MAEEQESGERTEEATPQRREDFRKQGQVAMTRELGTALILFGSSGIIWLFGKYFAKECVLLYEGLLGGFVSTSGRTGDFIPALTFAGTRVAFILLPVFGILGVLGFLSNAIQTGVLTNTDAITPNFEKINPINGLQKMFSIRSLVEGLKAVIKVSLVGLIAFLIIKSELMKAPQMSAYGVEKIILFYSEILVKILFGVGLFMIFLSILDYGYTWWELEKKMMMTKQELKEEIKSREGNPQIKARIRRIQREMAQKRMMEAVPKADVIITNPTHIAIALKYDENLPAPQIIAKGADLIAEKIKEVARQHGIPIVENKPLARTIFKTLKIGNVIPRELFHAVAEVLAYVYKLRRKAVQ